MNIDEVPSDYTSFYIRFITKEEEKLKKIKINNKIIHQSKLINYFQRKLDTKKIEKDLNDLLKKIKKDKELFCFYKRYNAYWSH